MRKVTVIGIYFLVLFFGLAVWTRPLPAQADNRLRIAVLFSNEYYSSSLGRTIRSALRSERRDIAQHTRERRPFYRFIKLNKQQGQLSTIIDQLIVNETEVIVSFEQQLTEQLLRIAPRFPNQQFYLFDRLNNSFEASDNIHLFSLEANTYNYLLGYFASLLLHYRFKDKPQAQTAVIAIGDVSSAQEQRAVTLGLRSVAIEHGYQYMTVSSKIAREELFDFFETLKRDDVEVVIVLTPTIVPRAFFRAAARHDIALITQQSRRYLRGAHVAQSEVDWVAIIANYLIPHIRYSQNRDVAIAAGSIYYGIDHRARIADADVAELISAQFNVILEKIALQKVNLQL